MKNQIILTSGIMFLISLTLLINGCSSDAKLEVEAQLVYSVGGPQPIAREMFFLYDVDPVTLNIPDSDGSRDRIVRKIIPFKNPTKAGSYFPTDPEVNAVIQPHVIKQVLTDFQGKAVFDNLRPGDYWLVGSAERRDSLTEYWMTKVTVGPGDNKILLSQDNSVK